MSLNDLKGSERNL